MHANPLHEKEATLDAQVDGIYRVLKGQINLENLIPTCIDVAQEIEKMGKRNGKDKLDLLQNVLRQALKDSDKSPEEKKQIFDTIDAVVPVIVHAAIFASKHPVVAEVHAACVGCWAKTK
jgi:hypothetical protein